MNERLFLDPIRRIGELLTRIFAGSPPAGRMIDETDYFRVGDNPPRTRSVVCSWVGGQERRITATARTSSFSNPKVTLRAAESLPESQPLSTKEAAMGRSLMIAVCVLSGYGTVCAQQNAPRTYSADGKTISYHLTVFNPPVPIQPDPPG